MDKIIKVLLFKVQEFCYKVFGEIWPDLGPSEVLLFKVLRGPESFIIRSKPGVLL